MSPFSIGSRAQSAQANNSLNVISWLQTDLTALLVALSLPYSRAAAVLVDEPGRQILEQAVYTY
jgi:hypothetical protein